MRRLPALVTLMLWMSACAEDGVDPAPQATPDRAPVTADFEPVTAVYRCRSGSGEVTLVTRTHERGLHVFLPPDPAGGHLECDHDHRASIWEHAKLNGVSFRAVGNEPGWVLEIRAGERLDLSYDYGQSELTVPITTRQPGIDGRVTIYSGSAGGQTMKVSLSGEGCSDTMSDETFPTRVQVELDGRTFSGCGRPLH